MINSGNGAAGPTFDAIAERLKDLGAPLEFVRVHHDPDPTFPNGIPNPLLVQNIRVQQMRSKKQMHFGSHLMGILIAVSYLMRLVVPGEYIVDLLATIFWKRSRFEDCT